MGATEAKVSLRGLGAPNGRRSFTCEIGTAGAVTLMLQIAMPCLLEACRRSGEAYSVTFGGGTNVPFSPPILHFEHVLLPLLNRCTGMDKFARVSMRVAKHGFMASNGGGIVELEVAPAESGLQAAEMGPIVMMERGEATRIEVYAFDVVSSSCTAKTKATATAICRVAEASLRAHSSIGDSVDISVYAVGHTVPHRHQQQRSKSKRRKKRMLDVPHSAGMQIVLITSTGCRLSENMLLRGNDIRQVEKRTRACVDNLMEMYDNGACVDEHTLDQLIIFMALCSGESRVRGPAPPYKSLHVPTAVHFASRFRGVAFVIKDEGKTRVYSVKGRPLIRSTVQPPVPKAFCSHIVHDIQASSLLLEDSSKYAPLFRDIISVVEMMEEMRKTEASSPWASILNMKNIAKEVDEAACAITLLEDFLSSDRYNGEGVTIVDTCAGKGVCAMLISLLRENRPALAACHRLCVVEKSKNINWKHIAAVNERSSATPIEVWNPINIFDDSFERRLRGISGSVVLLGIHLCRRMSPRLISMYNVLGPSARCLILAPCCLPFTRTPIEVHTFETEQERRTRIRSNTILRRRRHRSRGNDVCIYCCWEGHAPKDCPEAEKLDAEEMESISKAMGACWRCGEVGHSKRECTAPAPVLGAKTKRPSLVVPNCEDWLRRAKQGRKAIQRCYPTSTLSPHGAARFLSASKTLKQRAWKCQ